MTFTKKWKTLKSQAEAFASQTGAEIKIIIYNLENKKPENFQMSNITDPCRMQCYIRNSKRQGAKNI